jgi:hypothetical protein
MIIENDYGYYGIDETDKSDVEVSDEVQMAYIRLGRNERLFLSDWTQMESNTLSEEDMQKWETYRQALRDFPSVVEDLYTSPPHYPVAPNKNA